MIRQHDSIRPVFLGEYNILVVSRNSIAGHMSAYLPSADTLDHYRYSRSQCSDPRDIIPGDRWVVAPANRFSAVSYHWTRLTRKLSALAIVVFREVSRGQKRKQPTHTGFFVMCICRSRSRLPRIAVSAVIQIDDAPSFTAFSIALADCVLGSIKERQSGETYLSGCIYICQPIFCPCSAASVISSREREA